MIRCTDESRLRRRERSNRDYNPYDDCRRCGTNYKQVAQKIEANALNIYIFSFIIFFPMVCCCVVQCYALFGVVHMPVSCTIMITFNLVLCFSYFFHDDIPNY
eukprot:394961_1